MAHVIAVAGKGGVGKTTLCGMLIQYLCEKGKGPILAVDADANSNLNEVLGVEVETTLGDVREEIARAELASENPIPAGLSKADYAERRFEDALVEDDDFDLLVMGRTQGKGCYCFVNGLLQTQLAKYQNNYPYIVVDNEAGMEHISRGWKEPYQQEHNYSLRYSCPLEAHKYLQIYNWKVALVSFFLEWHAHLANPLLLIKWFW